MRFEGQTALVTGASVGLGAEYARQLHDLGCAVILVARREEKLRAIADQCNGRRAGSAQVVVADLGDKRGVDQVVSVVEANDVHLLVNNVGRGSFGFFDTLSAADEVQMVQLNVIAPLRLTHAVIPQMRERGYGAIINVSSIASFQPLPIMATYGATKSFNYSFSLALREECRAYGIRVLTVCPGPTATEFGEAAKVPEEERARYHDSPVQVVAESIAALRRNRAVVVPCLRSILLSLPSRILPKVWSTKVVGRMLKGRL